MGPTPSDLTLLGRMCLASAALLLTLPPVPVRAEPAVVAKLDEKFEDIRMEGQVRFDLGGGKLTGQAHLVVPSAPGNPPRRQNGKAPGRFDVTVDLDGSYAGGSFGGLQGAAKITGTFTDRQGCKARVQGTGTFKGMVSGPVGRVEVRCTWDRLEFDGCTLVSPQGFAALLPFVFEQTNVIPKLNEEPGPPASSSSSSSVLWWILAGVAFLFMVILISVGVVIRLRAGRGK